MKVSIRRGVFETNSSSTHSICIVPAEDFEAWKRGEFVLANDSALIPKDPDPDRKLTVYEWNGGKYVTKEVPDTVENREKYFYDEFATYESWKDESDLEMFEEHKVINGVKVVAFGKYGYNG